MTTLLAASTRSRASGFLQKLLAHEAVVLAQLGETRLDGGAVNIVHDLVADFADELAEVREMEVAAVFFLKLLLKRRHRDGRLLGEFVADRVPDSLLERW